MVQVRNGKPTRTEETQQEKEPEQVRNERQREAHKPTKKGTPPYRKGQAAVPLITNSHQKISNKSPWGDFEKIFGKIFRRNVSGERKTPCVVSTEGA